jgi:acetolactate synthase-1/2/3 large subunit
VAISSQVPRELIGRGRGYLHELPDQLASFAPVVKLAARAESVESIPELLAEAWRVAQTPPSGPVYLEVPVDVLTAEAGVGTVTGLSGSPVKTAARSDAIAEAARLINGAQRPVIWAGGGAIRSDAQDELRAIADVVLCVGTELGAETTGQYTLAFDGRLIQIDADAGRIGATYPALALVGDAKLTLAALTGELEPRSRPESRERVAQLRARILRGLESQGRDIELGLLGAIQDALPKDAISAWDMTILAYWAAPHLRIRGRQQFLYPLGSGTLGYAWPAAIGAAIAHPDRPALAVVGDGGIHYALAELATAAQYGVAAKLLLIDDGGYGILREYQRAAYGETASVDLAQPNFVVLARAFGVPASGGGADELAAHLAWALSADGPAAVVVRAQIASAQPTT